MFAFIRYCILLTALVLGLPYWPAAQVLDPTFHIPEIYREAYVKDAAQLPNGQYIVAGTFTRANGQLSNHLILLSAAGTVDQTFRQNLRDATVQVSKVYPLPNGQLLMLGDYQAGSIQRNNLFRLNADGTLDPTLNLFYQVKQALVQPDGRVFILSYSTNNTVEVYRLLSDGSRDPSFNVTLLTNSQDAQMLLQPDGKLVLGGDVAWVNGTRDHPFLARLNTDGSTDTGFMNGAYTGNRLYITALALDANGCLVVGGPTANVVGGQSQSIFRLLPSGALDPSFRPAASLLLRNCERLAVQPGGQLMALFDTYAPTATGSIGYPFGSQLVRLLPSGDLDTTFQPGSGADGTLTDVQSQANGSLLTWGSINNYAGQRRTLALLQPNGQLDAGFAPLLQEPGFIQKILRQPTGDLLLMGSFNSIDGHLTDRLARLLPNGQPDLTFAWRQTTSATLTLSAVATQGSGQVVVSGYTLLSASGGDTQPFLTRLLATGAPDASFVPAITFRPAQVTPIRLLAEQASGQLLVGGDFVDAAGKANLTRLTNTGSVDPTFIPPANQPVIYNGFVQDNGLIACVVPLPINASYPYYRQTIERLLANGQLDPSFSPVFPIPTNDLQVIFPVPTTGGYVANGLFDSDQVLARVTSTGALVPGFATPFRSFPSPADPYTGVNTVAAQPDGQLLVGGFMRQGSSTAAPITRLARLGADGQLDATFSTTFITAPSNGVDSYSSIYAVNSLLTQPDGATLVGGYFLAAGGQPATGLVRLVAPVPLAVEAPKPSSADVQAWPIPAHGVVHLAFSPVAHPQRVSLLNTLGAVMLSQAVSQAETTLDIAALAPGFYLLRTEYAGSVATRPILVE